MYKAWIHKNYSADQMEKQRVKQNQSSSEIDTTALYDNLFKSESLERFLQNNQDELNVPSFCEYIGELCRRRKETAECVIKRANIERSFGHQIFSGRRNPSRDTVIQLAFGFEVDVDSAQILLKYAERSQLYPRVKRDAAIIYCLHNHISILDTQTVLFDLSLPLLGERRK